MKEVWEVAEAARPRHPHDGLAAAQGAASYNEFGGSFIYPMGEDKVCIGLVVGLDYTDATFSCPRRPAAAQDPPLRQEDPRGRQAGRLGREDDSLGRLLGDAEAARGAGHGDRRRRRRDGQHRRALKGVHYAMHAGMYAAEAIVEALKKDSVNFEAYDEKVHNSLIEKDIYRSRNMRQPLLQGASSSAARSASAMTITKGAFPGGHWKQEDDAETAMEIGKRRRRATRSPTTSSPSTSSTRSSSRATRPATTRPTTSGCRPGCRARSPRPGSRCARRRSTRSPRTSSRTAPPTVDVHVTASNCVQCGAITAKGGRLTLPEGGDGPLYQET